LGFTNGIVRKLVVVFACVHALGLYGQLPDAVSDWVTLEKLTTQYPDSAYALLKLQAGTARTKRDGKAEAQCLQQMGMILYHLGNYTQAMEHLLGAEKIDRAEQLNLHLAETLNSLGTVCYYNKQPALAEAYFAEALSLFSAKNNLSGLANTHANIGRMYEKRAMPDSALHYQWLALAFAKADAKPGALAKIYENMGSVWEDREQYDSAQLYYTAALALNDTAGNSLANIEIINNLGDVLRKTNRTKQGLEYTRKAMLLAEAMQEKYQLSSAYRDMARSFQLLGQYDSAYYFLDLSRTVTQEIYTADNNRQIAVMQAVFDTERKNTEIARLNADKRINITIALAALAVLLLLGALAGVALSRQRLKLKNQAVHQAIQQQVYETQRGLMEADLKNKQLEEENLKQQLELKSNTLSSHILHLIQKNEVLESVKTGLAELIKDDKRDQKKQLRQLLQQINFSFSQDQYWEEFRLIFDQVHQSFFATLQQQCPELTATELRLLSLVKMNLNSQDMATLLGITPDSLRVTRYRVKKKLNLDQGESLTNFIQGLAKPAASNVSGTPVPDHDR